MQVSAAAVASRRVALLCGIEDKVASGSFGVDVVGEVGGLGIYRQRQ